jgi:hypothetical protein
MLSVRGGRHQHHRSRYALTVNPALGLAAQLAQASFLGQLLSAG